MILNLVGPPAVGKSTFAARFVLEHPEYRYCSIDGYRIQFGNEELAWGHLLQDVLEKRNIVLETCGLSWRLKDIFNNETIRRRPIFTLALTGDSKDIHDRLSKRQKREVPYPHHWTEHESVDFVLEHLFDSVAPIDVVIDTSNFKDAGEVYEVACRHIANARIGTFGKRKRRKDSFTRGY